jgi:small Trp-rich protein
MPFVWVGAVFVLLKWLEIGPVAQWSWWWVLAPLVVAFLWFEFFESIFGRDKKSKEHDEYDKLKEDRNRAVWGDRMPAAKPARAKR